MKIVFAYKGRYWVRDTRTLEILSAMAKAAGHETCLAYDPDLFGVSDNVLSLPRLNRLLFNPEAAVRKAAASGADWVVLLENLTNRSWLENFIKTLSSSAFKGKTTVISYRGEASYRGLASIELLGEPERGFGEFLKALKGAVPEIIKAEGLADLDGLPLPDLDLFSPYENFSLSYMAYAGKGCSGACSYCEEPFYRQAYGAGYARLRRPARVAEELSLVKKRFKTREITFKDSVFTADKAWLREFLPFYKAAVGLPFKCFGRPDAFDAETAAMLKEAGCYCVEFGLQTFNKKLRSAVLKRPESLEAVKKAFAACGAAGLPYDADYIFGLPGETEADHLEAALEFSRLKGLNRIKCHNLVYYKGLGITDYALKEGLADENALSGGDFFSGDRSAPAMRPANAAFCRLFKLYGLLGSAVTGFAANSGLWRAFRFIPGPLLKPLELLSGLLRGDRRFLVYLRAYPARIFFNTGSRPAVFSGGNRAFLHKTMAVILSVLAALALAELGLRLAGPGPRRFNDSMRYYSNPRGYYEPVAVDGVRTVYGLHYNMTKEGFRLPDGVAGWSAVRDVRPAEILLLGDSFTFGRGVRYSDTYAARLEKILASRRPAWRVRNAGAVGLNVGEIGRVYAHEASGRKYKLAIYGFVLNDFGLEVEGGRAGSDFIDQNNAAPAARGLRAYSALLDLFFRAADRRRLTRQTVKAYQEAFLGPGAEAKYAVLRRLNARVKADGGKLVIMVFPLIYNFSDYPFREIHASLLAFCGREGIACLDLLPAFSRYRDRDLWAAPTDQHPNEIAHRLAAESLAEFLDANSLGPQRLSPERI
ncbi:MAG: hypothetical protein A2X35_11935 [Elusimicrobia bacterium GWA2_61_42]|nr:MAG: hypothetical protein A2X35_11935 [Elusimicrobia bacterium GWA2_61_42]OGR76357.1 MAG: hypothetical protein A2X38_01105 [Elusimicrobia bacterium GWC2_61_25]